MSKGQVSMVADQAQRANACSHRNVDKENEVPAHKVGQDIPEHQPNAAATGGRHDTGSKHRGPLGQLNEPAYMSETALMRSRRLRLV